MYRTSSGAGMGPMPGQRTPFNVQDYKEKRAAQLERARKIREERDCRKAVPNSYPAEQEQRPVPRVEAQPQPQPQRQQTAISQVDDMPIRSSAQSSQPIQRANAPPAKRRTAFEESAPSSYDSGSSNNSYGYESTGPGSSRPAENRQGRPAMPPVREVAKNSRTGHRLQIGEDDISGAVSAGIINLEQADKLWRHLLNEAPTSAIEGRPSSAGQPQHAMGSTHGQDAPSESRFRPTSAPEELVVRATQPTEHARRTLEYPEEDCKEDMSYKYPASQSRQVKSKKTGWNFDTEVAYEDDLHPEQPPQPMQEQRRDAGRRTATLRNAKPGWNNDFVESQNEEAFEERVVQPQPSKPRGNVPAAQPMNFQNSAPLGATAAADKLALLKARSSARAGQAPDKAQQQQQQQYQNHQYEYQEQQQYAPGIAYESSPFGPAQTRPPAQAQSRPVQQGYRSAPTQYNHSVPEEDYHTGRIIESEEERIIKGDRNAQLEVEMYEANNVPMDECHVCGRSFRRDRIKKHAAACEKASKQRKVFDISKQRQEGEAIKAAKEASRAPPRMPKRAAPKVAEALPKWKQQHLEFQNAIKSGRVAPGEYVAPVPVQDTRTECPHCGRRFAEDVAERHIPKCQNIVHKPKATFRRS